MAEIYLVKMANGCFAPASVDDADIAKKFKAGEVYPAKIWKKRNVLFHRKFFALMNYVLENQEKYENLEDLITEVKLRAGWYVEHVTLKGKMVYIPKSISFENMDDTDFEKLFSKAIDIVIKWFIKEMNAEKLDLIVDEIIGYAR